MINELTSLKEKVSRLVQGNKEWEHSFVPGFCQFLDYANTMSQVFLDVDLNMLSKLIEKFDQRDLTRDFLLDPNKNYLILVRGKWIFLKLTKVFNEEQELVSKPITSIDEMKSKQNLDDPGKSLASELSNMQSTLIENKNILGRYLETSNC